MSEIPEAFQKPEDPMPGDEWIESVQDGYAVKKLIRLWDGDELTRWRGGFFEEIEGAVSYIERAKPARWYRCIDCGSKNLRSTPSWQECRECGRAEQIAPWELERPCPKCGVDAGVWCGYVTKTGRWQSYASTDAGKACGYFHVARKAVVRSVVRSAGGFP